jgi:hypothetical protein
MQQDSHIGQTIKNLSESASLTAAAFKEAWDKLRSQGNELPEIKVFDGGDHIYIDEAPKREPLPRSVLHPTKGWRDGARQTKTNRRRKRLTSLV